MSRADRVPMALSYPVSNSDVEDRPHDALLELLGEWSAYEDLIGVVTLYRELTKRGHRSVVELRCLDHGKRAPLLAAAWRTRLGTLLITDDDLAGHHGGWYPMLGMLEQPRPPEHPVWAPYCTHCNRRRPFDPAVVLATAADTSRRVVTA